MLYSTASDVKLLTNTILENTIIEELIVKADAEIDDKLAEEGISVPSPTHFLITCASENLAAAKVLHRDWITDPTVDLQQQIGKFEKAGHAAIKDYIRQSKEIPPLFSVIENETDMD